MYVIQNWVNGSVGGTPVSASRLNHIEAGILATSQVADAAVASVNGRTGAVVLTAADVSSGNFPAGTFNFTGTLQEAGNRVYSAGNPPPYPVTSVAGRTGIIVLSATDVSGVYYSGNPPPYPVTSVAARTGAVVLTAADIGAGTFPGSVTFNQGFATIFSTASGGAGYVKGSGTQLVLRGGTSGLSVRNNADTVDILDLDNTGALSFAGILTVGGLSGSGSAILITGGSGNQSIEIGRQDGVSSTPFIDFHSGATAVDYDVRFQVQGGTGVSGGGSLYVFTGDIVLDIGATSDKRFRLTSDAATSYFQTDKNLAFTAFASGTARAKINTDGSIETHGVGSALLLFGRDNDAQNFVSYVNGNIWRVYSSTAAADRITVDSSGNLTIAGGLTLTPTTTTTAPTGGAAGALPANPVGYMSITIAGTVRKIPYYT